MQTMNTREDVWKRLAEPVDPKDIAWRQDGKPMTRDGRHFARFVCYIEANTVRERLDTVVPGEWDLTIDPLPVREVANRDGVVEGDPDTAFSFKARLQVLGVIREDVGHGKDWKQASTDAFKRVAVRFGIGHELYDMEMNWVELDGDGKYAKPVEDPGKAYERRHGRKRTGDAPPSAQDRVEAARAESDADGQAPTGSFPEEGPAPGSDDIDAVNCPKCGGRMWDNRRTKRNPKAPDYKCRDRRCDGVVWPPKNAGESKGTVMDEQDVPKPTRARKSAKPVDTDTDEIPF